MTARRSASRPSSSRARGRFVWVVATLFALTGTACKRTDGANESGPAGSGSVDAPALPPLSVKDDTPGALFTWVDDQGDFHVVERTADVPEANRGTVRVVVSGQSSGSGESVYVADLTKKNPDGTYAVRTMGRSVWDELGASKRKSRLEALAPKAAPSTAPLASGDAPAAGVGQVTATIYGASWCGPCHQAEALLKSLGVQVTKKDIEESDAAQREMQEKLRKVHRQGGSIPVIDVMGQIFVGFSDAALRAAVSRARGATL
jgi:glutaredoxin